MRVRQARQNSQLLPQRLQPMDGFAVGGGPPRQALLDAGDDWLAGEQRLLTHTFWIFTHAAHGDITIFDGLSLTEGLFFRNCFFNRRKIPEQLLLGRG